MTQFLQNLLSGLAAGSLYAVIAVGIVLVYKSSRVLNFAHGAVATVATFVAWQLSTSGGVAIGWAMLAAVAVAFLLGAAAYAALLDRARQGGEHALVMVTIGLYMVLEGGAAALWGADPKDFHHLFAEARSFDLPGGVVLSLHEACVIGLALAMSAALWVFFRATRVGVALRAVSQNPTAAELLGVRVPRVHALTWGIAIALGAVAVILLAPKLLLDPSMMFSPLLKAFAAAVLGGMSSVAGAILGAWILGVVETLAGAYVSTEFQATIAFVIIVVVLVVRPEGILGKPEVRKV